MLLLDRIKASPKARIVTVSSSFHMPGVIHFDDINLENGYNPTKAYNQSKLANVLFSRELARRLSNTNISTYSLHPGGIRTDLQRHIGMASTRIVRALMRIYLISPELGAQTTLYCALDDSVANESGQYYSNCQRFDKTNPNVNDADAKRLWQLSCDLLKLEDRHRLN